jgi:thiol-disulfide isomerase/thioredoxin
MPISHHRRAGMATPLIVTIILVAAALAGAALYSVRNGEPEVTPTPDVTPTPVVSPGTGGASGSAAIASGSFAPEGAILAGTVSPLIEFNRADYDRALAEGKTILLYFYANWCPICRVEFQDTQGAFRELNEPDIVGFRVSYNDSETDDNEESLARQFGIAYQHTKVVLVDGTPVLKDGSTWDRDKYLQEINTILNQ